MGFKGLGFRVLGFSVFVLRVLAFKGLGFRVLGFKGLGFRALGLKGLRRFRCFGVRFSLGLRVSKQSSRPRMLASLLPARARLQPRVFSGVAKWEVQNCLLQHATGSTRSQCIRNAVTSQIATAAEYLTSAEHVGIVPS